MIKKDKIYSNFTIVPNSIIYDKQLSSKAILIYLYLASKPEHWEVRNEDIMEKLSIKNDKTVAKLLKELIDYGWLSRKRNYGQYSYVLNSDPEFIEEDDLENCLITKKRKPLITKKRKVDKIYTAENCIENTQNEKIVQNLHNETPATTRPETNSAPYMYIYYILYNYIYNNNIKINNIKTYGAFNPKSADFEDENFEKFWKAYPARKGWKYKKAKAKKSWKSGKLVRHMDEIMRNVEFRKENDPKWLEGFPPDAVTYLNQRGWEEENGKTPDQLEEEKRLAAEKEMQAEHERIMSRLREEGYCYEEEEDGNHG